MDKPSYACGMEVQRRRRRGVWMDRFAALVLLFLLASPAFATGVPVRDGETVLLRICNILTTDNVRKGDVIQFEVRDDIVVNGHVVIAKGAKARGKIVDIKGAFKPRANDAEVALVQKWWEVLVTLQFVASSFV